MPRLISSESSLKRLFFLTISFHLTFSYADLIAYLHNDQVNKTGTRYQASLAAFGMQIKEEQAVPGYLIVAEDLVESEEASATIASASSSSSSPPSSSSPSSSSFNRKKRSNTLLKKLNTHGRVFLTLDELKDLSVKQFIDLDQRDKIDASYACGPIKHKNSVFWDGPKVENSETIKVVPAFADMDHFNYYSPLNPLSELEFALDGYNTDNTDSGSDNVSSKSDDINESKHHSILSMTPSPGPLYIRLPKEVTIDQENLDNSYLEYKVDGATDADVESDNTSDDTLSSASKLKLKADTSNTSSNISSTNSFIVKLIQKLPHYPINFFISTNSNRPYFITSLWNFFTKFRTGEDGPDDFESPDYDDMDYTDNYERKERMFKIPMDFTDLKSFEQEEGLIKDDEDSDRFPAAPVPRDGKDFLKSSPVMLKNIKNVFVMVQRGNCSFARKVYNAQQAGYDGVVVYDDESDTTISMHADPREDGVNPSSILIPSVFVGRSVSRILYNHYIFKPTDDIRNLISQPFIMLVSDDNSIIDYLLPLSLILIVCLITMMMFSCFRILRNWRDNRKNRLTRKKLKKLPKKIFKKEEMKEDYETCAICLEDYNDGDKLRVLPCDHAYHTSCIDPWLTQNRRNCPLCKRNVLSDDDSEANTNATDVEISISSTSGSDDVTSGSGTGEESDEPLVGSLEDLREDVVLAENVNLNSSLNGNQQSLVNQVRASQSQSSVGSAVERSSRSSQNRKSSRRRSRSRNATSQSRIFLEGFLATGQQPCDGQDEPLLDQEESNTLVRSINLNDRRQQEQQQQQQQGDFSVTMDKPSTNTVANTTKSTTDVNEINQQPDVPLQDSLQEPLGIISNVESVNSTTSLSSIQSTMSSVSSTGSSVVEIPASEEE